MRCCWLAVTNSPTKTITAMGYRSVSYFAQDRQACLPLPGIGFDPVRYEPRKADRRGYIQVEANTYAAGPSFHGRALTVGIRADTIEILDEDTTPVVTFQRVFGRHEGTIFEPAALLPLLMAKPRSWSHPPVRRMVDDPIRDWLDTAPAADRRRLFESLHEAATATDFATATTAATRLITAGDAPGHGALRSEEHTSELQSRGHLVCRLLLEKKNT